LIGCFIAGLQDEIRLDVKIKQPHTLVDIIGVARLIEERNQLQKRNPLPIRSVPNLVPTSVIAKTSPNPTAGVTPRHRGDPKNKSLIYEKEQISGILFF